ncbi:hypothetical protein [Psychrobacter sanguinis]|uniref:hypothetical protein n=1 Tax=Psychrobacter sanguinis TaxID=861445 RepID=UPI00191B19DB|nr:hypothetical protein [Psychrobacter sanguinis]MCC3307657.1 hypothetical protein [Psychrobacter sanguinis]
MSNNKIRYRKVRGINRRKRLINEWGEYYKTLDLNRLQQTNHDYAKLWVRPWSDSLLINSIPAEPTGELETLLIANLLKIYQSWENTLQQLDGPYYLAIWLFEQSISRSQVLCTIKEPMDFSNVFEPVERQPDDGIKSSNYYNEQTAQFLDGYQWTLYRHIQFYNLADPDDLAYIQELDSSRLLRKQTLGDADYQAVETDKVWLLVSDI